MKTGGIYGTPMISPHEEHADSVHHFFFRGKCMLSRVDDLLHLFKEILLHPTFDDPERFKQIVLEHKSDLESSVIPKRPFSRHNTTQSDRSYSAYPQ